MPNNNDMPELLPCPFCGSNDLRQVVHDLSGDDQEPFGYSISCNVCFVDLPPEPTQSDGLKAWNTRADKAAESVQDIIIPHARAAAMEAFEILTPNMEAAIQASEGTEADQMQEYWDYIGEYVKCPLLPVYKSPDGDDINSALEDMHNWMETFNAPHINAHNLLCKHWATFRHALSHPHQAESVAPKQEPVNAELLAALKFAEDTCRYMDNLSRDNLLRACQIEQRCRKAITRAQAEPIQAIEGLEEALEREDGWEWTLMFNGTGKNIEYGVDCRKVAIEQVMAITKAARAYLRLQQPTRDKMGG